MKTNDVKGKLVRLLTSNPELPIVARNGSDGSPDIFDRTYADWHDAQERADWMNDEDGITDAPRFDDF